MNENSSQTIKEITEDIEIKNSSVEENASETQNDQGLSYDQKDIPSADSSSSRRSNDLDDAGFTQEEFASLLGKYDKILLIQTHFFLFIRIDQSN